MTLLKVVKDGVTVPDAVRMDHDMVGEEDLRPFEKGS